MGACLVHGYIFFKRFFTADTYEGYGILRRIGINRFRILHIPAIWHTRRSKPYANLFY